MEAVAVKRAKVDQQAIFIARRAAEGLIFNVQRSTRIAHMELASLTLVRRSAVRYNA